MVVDDRGRRNTIIRSRMSVGDNDDDDDDGDDAIAVLLKIN